MSHPFSAASRSESIATLEGPEHDLLIIGAGITGAGIARDAAMRGLRVALVEREDFGSGTSSRSSRLVHGGLRYLEHGHLHLVFESSRERRILLRIAPHLVRPQPFIWPVYQDARVPRWKLAAGLFLYDALSLFRNVASHQRLSTAELLRQEPALRQPGLRGGARYYDARTNDIRLTLANARAAAEAGATVANHVEVRELLIDGGPAAIYTGGRRHGGYQRAVRGAIANDVLSGQRLTIRARTVVNATGPWSDVIRRFADGSAAASLRGTKGVHIAVPRERVGNRNALTLLSPIDGRVIFLLPAGPLTVVGTTDTDYDGPLDPVHATRSDIAYLLRSANAFFPGAHLIPGDVVSAWAGIRPLVGGGTGDPGRASREHALTWTAPGLLTISGGKLTTYRAMAREVVDEVTRALGDRRPRRSPTDRAPLPGGDFLSADRELAAARDATGMPSTAEHLVHAYGREWRDVWAIVGSNAALAAPVSPTLPYIVAELHFAIQREMAMTLSDLLIRRMHIAYEARDHGAAAAPAVARVVAPLLGWSADDMRAQLGQYQRDVARVFQVEE